MEEKMQTQSTSAQALDVLRKLRTFLVEHDYYGSEGQIAEDCRDQSRDVWLQWLSLMANVDVLLDGAEALTVPEYAEAARAEPSEAELIAILREAASNLDPKTDVFQVRMDKRRFLDVVRILRDTHKLIVQAENQPAWKYHFPYQLTRLGKEALETGRIPEPFVC